MNWFDQKGQVVWGLQQNAGRDIINNYPKAAWTPPLMLPPRAQSFVGRKEDLAWLLQQFTGEAGRIVALCGPGGIGKTALAAEALTCLVAQQDWLVRFPGGIFYHSFYTYPSLTVAFEELARLLGEDPGADPHRAALRALSCRRTLLVFDGVEVLADALPLWELGSKHLALLLSRRQSDAPDLAHRRNLDLLSQDQAIALLQRLAGPRTADRPCVERLVQHIGGYPLALQLIGSYLSSREENVADYLRWFEREGLATVDFGKHQAQSVPVLLQRTYDALDPSEQHLFLLLGLLAPVPFRSELVRGILELSEQALGPLVNLSVLRRLEQDYEVSHPLVHTFAKERFSSQVDAATIAIWQERALTTLATHFDQSDPFDLVALSLWQPHILPLLSVMDLTNEQWLKAARLFNTVGFNALVHGKYTEMEPLVVRALEICEQQLGAVHPDTASSLNNLAGLYLGQGKVTEAEPLCQRALAIREQQLGATHPDTASTLDNLALIYRNQGKMTEAEPLCQRALVIREQQLGATHPDTALSLNSLAELYCRQEKYVEAEPLLTRALAIYEQLSTTHYGMANCLMALAVLYKNQRKYTKAEPLYQRSLAICEQRLGPTHFNVAFGLNNLALLYHSQGKYAKAEPLLVRALAMQEQQWGATNPFLVQTLSNLAGFYKSQKKYTKAEPLYQRALAIHEQHFGATDPDTAFHLSNLAGLYHSQKKHTEAEPLYLRALSICEQELGATHPNTARALHSLGAVYHGQGNYAEAELLYRRALAIYKEKLGTAHPDTQGAIVNYAKIKYLRVLSRPLLFLILTGFLIIWFFHRSDLIGWVALFFIWLNSGQLVSDGLRYLSKRSKRQPTPT